MQVFGFTSSRNECTDRFGKTVILLLTTLMLVIFVGSASMASQVTLTWWVNRHDVEMPYWQEMAKRFEAENPDIKIEIINAMGQGGLDQLMTLILSGMAPDVVRGETNWMPDFAGNHLFVDLRPYIERDKAELALEEFPQPALDAFTWQGTQYALPMVMSSLVYKYNKVKYLEAGVAFPDGSWTWEEFLEVSKSLTRMNPNGEVTQYGVQIPRALGNRAVIWLWQNGGELFSPDYREILIDQSESVEALEFVRALMHDHRVAASPLEERRLGSDLLVSQNAAGQINGPWRRGALNTVEDLDWDIAPLPRSKNEATVILAGGISIMSQSRHPEEAWRFVKYLTGTEAQYIWAENGQSSPARIPVALSNSFLSAGRPENARVYIDVITNGRPEPAFPGWATVHRELNQLLGQFWNGNMDTQRAVAQVKAQGQAIMNSLDNF